MSKEADDTAVTKASDSQKKSRTKLGERLPKLNKKLPKLTTKQKKVATGVAAAAAGVAVAAAGVAVARKRRARGKETTVYHVVPKDDRWEVRGEGAQRATSVHETKREAVAAARQRARDKEPSRLVVHRLDGTVQDSFAYG